MAGSTITVHTDGVHVNVALVECGKHNAKSIALRLCPTDAEQIGQRLIEVARVARIAGAVG